MYTYDGWKIAQVNDGSGYMVQQFIHGTQYIDELVMMRAAGRGDLYVHQGESRLCRDERERPATGKAGTTPATGPRVCPQDASTTRATGGANWNVIALTDLGGSVVERSTYTPYGELTVHQVTGYGDRDGDGTVDATDKGTPGVTCTGPVAGACRLLDLDFDGDYDSADATLFDSLPQGLGRHPGRTATGVRQPFGHQGLVEDVEIASKQNRHRQYSSTKRRWLQRDPLAFQVTVFISPLNFFDGMNLYEYTGNSPISRRDPQGLVYDPNADDIGTDCPSEGATTPCNVTVCCRCGNCTFSTFRTTTQCTCHSGPGGVGNVWMENCGWGNWSANISGCQHTPRPNTDSTVCNCQNAETECPNGTR